MKALLSVITLPQCILLFQGHGWECIHNKVIVVPHFYLLWVSVFHPLTIFIFCCHVVVCHIKLPICPLCTFTPLLGDNRQNQTSICIP